MSRNSMWSRRNFLEFMGRSALAVSLPMPVLLDGCAPKQKESFVIPLEPSIEDELVLVHGLQYKVLIKQGDLINLGGDSFGDHNDYIAFLPINDTEANLWVNHEYITPIFISGTKDRDSKLIEQIDNEMKMVGGSFLRITKGEDGYWNIDRSASINRRIDANTPMSFSNGVELEGSSSVVGTMGNCSGGITPWNTILTCEENTEDYFGKLEFDTDGGRTVVPKKWGLGWERFYPRPPEHYGWVVEFNPENGECKKLIGLGRFAHECATVNIGESGIPVVYTGDDDNDECLYKFIASQRDSLDEGNLYVANMEAGKWIPIDFESNPVLKRRFDSQLEVMVRCREAAKIVGGSPLDCPEDIAIDPVTGAIIVSLTNNKPNDNYYGSLLKIVEKDNDPLALEFESETLISGGLKSGFACPDNLCFDKKGNLWVTSDVSTSELNNDTYKAFGNNGIFFIPMSGDKAGVPIRIASAPVEAELTGLAFSEDEATLFVSVQHPGDETINLAHPTSHWPNGGTEMPRSAVVMITGEALSRLSNG